MDALDLDDESIRWSLKSSSSCGLTKRGFPSLPLWNWSRLFVCECYMIARLQVLHWGEMYRTLWPCALQGMRSRWYIVHRLSPPLCLPTCPGIFWRDSGGPLYPNQIRRGTGLPDPTTNRQGQLWEPWRQKSSGQHLGWENVPKFWVHILSWHLKDSWGILYTSAYLSFYVVKSKLTETCLTTLTRLFCVFWIHHNFGSTITPF